MFRLGSAALGFASFLLLVVLFQRNYSKLEERLKTRAPAVVVQAPSGPTAEDIAAAVEDRVKRALADMSRGGSTLSYVTVDALVPARTAAILPKLTTLTGEGERIFRAVIGDPQQLDNLPRYQREIEDWRARVGQTYEAELPNSGAREIVFPKTGALGIGPVGYELSRLVAAINAQKAVISDLEKYVRRSLLQNSS